MPVKQRELARSAATRPQRVSAKTAALLELGETRRRRGGRRGGSRHRQVAVEAHGDDTKKQSSARRCTDEGAACGREAVLDERAQPLQRGREIDSEVDSVAPLDSLDVDLTAAHELLNRVRAQQVVGTKLQAASHRQTVLRDGRLPSGDLALILAEAAADVADRAGTESDQVAAGVRRVSHEVAVQTTVFLGPCQIVFRKGEMVHTDVAIAGGAQPFHRQLQQRQTLLRPGQIGARDLTLGLEEGRHVSVAINRDTLRPRRDHGVERVRETRGRLQWQPVDQIEVDRSQSRAATRLDDRQSLGDALHAVDGLLHSRIEVLDTEADAIEAQLRQHRDITVMDVARIELDRKLTLADPTEAKAVGEGGEQPGELGPAQEIRSPAPEVQLHHLTACIEQRRNQPQLLQQPLDVMLSAGRVTADGAVAAAVEARAEAVGDVNVERDRARRDLDVAAPRPAAQLLLAEVLTELSRGRIRGVPGAGGVVATQHPDVENWLRAHRPQVGPRARDCLSWKAAPDPHRHRGSSVL